MRQDREAYCDWTVLNGYDTDDERLAYGDTLLRFASKKNNTLVYTANGLFSNKKQIKYRIERIADYKAESKLKKLLVKVLLCCCLLQLCCKYQRLRQSLPILVCITIQNKL